MPVTALVAAGQLALAAAAALNVRESVEVRADALFAVAEGRPASLDDLSAFGDTLDAVTGYARLIAGRGPADARFVDGLPSRITPAGRKGIRIAIDANPFGVERAAGAVTAVDILTGSPGRHLSFSINGLGSALAAGAGITRESPSETSIDVSTGVRGLPLIASARLSRMSVRSERTTAAGALAPSSGFRSERAASIFYASPGRTPRVHASFSAGTTEDRWTNPDAGGIVSPETSQTLTIRAGEYRARLAVRHRAALVSGILAIQRDAIAVHSAGEDQPARHIAGFLSEGTDVVRLASTSASSLGRLTVSAPDRSWIAGIDFTRARREETREPNPLGRWHFGSASSYEAWGDSRESALHVRTRHAQTGMAAIADSAFFLEITRHGLTAGGRLARAAPGGMAFLPRLSWQHRIRQFRLHAGAGLFRDASSADSLLTMFTNEQAISSGPDVPLLYVPVRMTVARNFEPPRSFMARVAAAWHRTHISAFIDHSWTRGWRLPSYTRRVNALEVVDVLQSSNHATGVATAVRLLARSRSTQLVINGVHERARDDGARGGYEQGVWARATGVSPLSITAAGTAEVGKNLRLTATVVRRSGAAIDVFAGAEPNAAGLFLDRGGLRRNSGRGPAYASLDLSIQASLRQLHLTLMAGNVLDTRNATAFGAVVRSPTFRFPLGYLPGRTISIAARLRK